MGSTRANALDHVVLVLFENRSFDNLLGRLYQPGEVSTFEGVTGKDLSNPIPDWAEHTGDATVVPYGVATGMDSPNPDPGEEYQHTNTQLFNVLDEVNRFKDATEMVAPFNAPAPGQEPTMDGFVTDYISFFTVEMGRQPTYDEYSQIMTGYTRGTGAGAQRDRPGLRRLRPLVLRGPLTDDDQPVVLDGGDLVRLRGEPTDEAISCTTTTPRRSSTGSSSTARPGRSTCSSPTRSPSPA